MHTQNYSTGKNEEKVNYLDAELLLRYAHRGFTTMSRKENMGSAPYGSIPSEVETPFKTWKQNLSILEQRPSLTMN